ncbi:MAG TPA: hypothetical protein PLP17_09875, partial [Oligoflexia bacterium]|nr:hypothetical protein [Oligoflexia bacterium]
HRHARAAACRRRAARLEVLLHLPGAASPGENARNGTAARWTESGGNPGGALFCANVEVFHLKSCDQSVHANARQKSLCSLKLDPGVSSQALR